MIFRFYRLFEGAITVFFFALFIARWREHAHFRRRWLSVFAVGANSDRWVVARWYRRFRLAGSQIVRFEQWNRKGAALLIDECTLQLETMHKIACIWYIQFANKVIRNCFSYVNDDDVRDVVKRSDGDESWRICRCGFRISLQVYLLSIYAPISERNVLLSNVWFLQCCILKILVGEVWFVNCKVVTICVHWYHQLLCSSCWN